MTPNNHKDSTTYPIVKSEHERDGNVAKLNEIRNDKDIMKERKIFLAYSLSEIG